MVGTVGMVGWWDSEDGGDGGTVAWWGQWDSGAVGTVGWWGRWGQWGWGVQWGRWDGGDGGDGGTVGTVGWWDSGDGGIVGETGAEKVVAVAVGWRWGSADDHNNENGNDEAILYLIWGLCFASIICCNPSDSQQDGSDRLYPATWEAKSRIPRCHTQKQVANRWQNPSLSDSRFHSLGKRLRTEEEKAVGNGAGWPPALTTLFTVTSCRPLSRPAAQPQACSTLLFSTALAYSHALHSVHACYDYSLLSFSLTRR